MTIDQQLRDRFDRMTEGSHAPARPGRRHRRRPPEPPPPRARRTPRGSLAVVAVAATRRGRPAALATRRPVAATPAADDGTFVPGHRRSTPTSRRPWPPPTRRCPRRRTSTRATGRADTPLPDADFANATEWQLVYDLSPHVELLVYVTKPIRGCNPAGQRRVGTGRARGRGTHVDSDRDTRTARGSVGSTACWSHPDGRRRQRCIEQVDGSDARAGTSGDGADRRAGPRPSRRRPGSTSPTRWSLRRPVASDGCLASRSRTPARAPSPSSSATARSW